MRDPVHLLQQLLRCPSVTPKEGGALDVIEHYVTKLGFSVERIVFQDKNTPDVENLYASIGTGTPHLMFAGHVDVVPPGDEQAWTYPPFGAEIAEGLLYGRGAVDMKGGIAAFLAAVDHYLNDHQASRFRGRLSLLITGDEEGPAINGTVKLLKWAHMRGERWDAALVGEPTNPEILGEMIKVGRRGSLSGILTITGRQGHVAYPHLAANPLTALASYLSALKATALDEGSEYFQPSNLELTSIDTGNAAANVIPARVKITFNIRFNDLWNVETLKQEIEKRLNMASHAAVGNQNQAEITHHLTWLAPPADVFRTEDKKLVTQLKGAIAAVTGQEPSLSTSGGTSDARFIKDYCPVIEFGLVGQTMHQINESVPVEQVEQLTAIYHAFLEEFFAASEQFPKSGNRFSDEKLR